MARLQRKNLRHPDELRPLGRGTLELVELGDATIGRVTYQPGWRWSEDLKPLVGTDLCEIHHVGFVVQGTLRVLMADGSTVDLQREDVFEVPPGHDAWVVGDESFIAVDSRGRRFFGKALDDAERRVLGTILFTDIVNSTQAAARLGDAAWQGVLADLNESTRMSLERYRGREIQTTGDGVLAVFESPERGVRCGLALARAAKEQGLSIRAGLHTGEYEPAGTDIRGLAVHVAARVMGSAVADEVRISAATAALLDRSAFALMPLGPVELKGVAEAVELYSVSTPD
jgi:class 3 adenylate cyclase